MFWKKTKPLLILLDNASDKIAKNLRKCLEDRVAEKEIWYSSTMFLVLYVVRKVDTLSMMQDNLGQEKIDTIFMKQELSKHEKIIFYISYMNMEKKSSKRAQINPFLPMSL